MRNLDDIKLIERCDDSGMLTSLESFPEQCHAAKTIGYKFDLPGPFRRRYEKIVCTGLGGSAIGADVARSYLSDTSATPIFVNRNYTLPGFVGKDTLVIASSYSGNTEETISAYRDAVSRRAKIMVVTSGGELKRMAQRRGDPVLEIPGGLQPRCALGYSFFPLLILLSKMGITKDAAGDIDDAIKMLHKMKDGKIGRGVGTSSNPAKAIARQLYMRFPVIYACQEHLDSVATRWRGQLAENSKTLSSTHVFPEMNHNEIVGWDNPKGLLKHFTAVILRDKGEHPRNAKRVGITRDILKKANIKSIEVKSIGPGLLSRIFSLIYIGDFVSYYLAILNGRDPTPVDRIAYLKDALAKKV